MNVTFQLNYILNEEPYLKACRIEQNEIDKPEIGQKV